MFLRRDVDRRELSTQQTAAALETA
jgi:hypothetical protein